MHIEAANTTYYTAAADIIMATCALGGGWLYTLDCAVFVNMKDVFRSHAVYDEANSCCKQRTTNCPKKLPARPR